eukprot:snap_masked-scaffold_13-processed-gene-3.43-mRNA-1 protein AED:1.00 eAED:1.00 QI:0/0/0/0/1/1/2/0/66
MKTWGNAFEKAVKETGAAHSSRRKYYFVTLNIATSGVRGFRDEAIGNFTREEDLDELIQKINRSIS